MTKFSHSGPQVQQLPKDSPRMMGQVLVEMDYHEAEVKVMATQLSSDGAAAVDRDYHWRPVGQDTPMNAKLQLINRGHGVATYGKYTPKSHWTHWAPLPVFADDREGRPMD